MGRGLLARTFPCGAVRDEGVTMSSTMLMRLPWPDGWSSPRRLKWIILSSYLGVMGVAMFVVGVASLFDDEPTDGVGVIFGSLLLFLATAQGILKRVIVRRKVVETIHVSTFPDSGEAAIVVPYSKLLFWLIFSLPALLLAGIGPLAVAAIFGALVAPDTRSVVVAVLCTICAAYLLACVVEFMQKKIVCGYVALSPTGIYHRSWALTSFVPWEHVVEIWPFEGGGPVITVQAVANADGWSRRTSRFWKQSESGFGLNLTVRGMYLSVDPALLYHAMQFYFNNPPARSELSGEAAVRRLKRADIPMPARRP